MPCFWGGGCSGGTDHRFADHLKRHHAGWLVTAYSRIAFAISLCLPFCQLQKANIIVDFFTQSTSTKTRQSLDAMGNLLLIVLYWLLAWRTSVGAMSVREAGETTMIISLPMWWAYACLAPGLALAGWVALVQALSGWSTRGQEVQA